MADGQNPGLPELPPSYGAVSGEAAPSTVPHHPQPGPNYAAEGYPEEPPPKYEPPKDQNYPIQTQPTGFPPHNAGYQADIHHTVYVTDIRWGPLPQLIQCPHCYAQVTTHTTYKPGALTWLSGGLICLFGCWAGCCLIPLCIPDLLDVEHRCPNCGTYLGMHTRV